MSRYRVTGPVPYMGYQPGEVFEAELDPDQERRALARGSIKQVKAKKQEPDQNEEESDA